MLYHIFLLNGTQIWFNYNNNYYYNCSNCSLFCHQLYLLFDIRFIKLTSYVLWHNGKTSTTYLAALQIHHRHLGTGLGVASISTNLSKRHSARLDPRSTVLTRGLREQTRFRTEEIWPPVAVAWTLQEHDHKQSRLTISPARQFH